MAINMKKITPKFKNTLWLQNPLYSEYFPRPASL
jgi:hypothetical protein